MSTLYLKGFVRDVKYNPCLNPTKYESYSISDFDVIVNYRNKLTVFSFLI